MKKKKNKIFIFTLLVFGMFCDKVLANSYDTFLKTNANSTLKTGDVIELNAGIACASNEAPVTNHKFTLIYDKNVFDLAFYDDDNPYKLRTGWELLSYGHSNYEGTVEVKTQASSSNYYINEDIASSNCSDNKEAVLVSYKLKVKKTSNQSTKVQVINDVSYVKELTFNIHNNASNNFLSSLKVKDYEFDKVFDKKKKKYEVSVPYVTDKVNIVAVADDTNAKISGDGEKKLEVGDNKLQVVVTAENGSKKTYTIVVTRKDADDDTSLSKVIVRGSDKEKISLVYDKKTKTYRGEVSADITFVTFDIKCSGEDCSVDEMEAEALKEGKNEFKFNVISQNSDKEEYKIIITKEKEIEKKDTTSIFLLIGLGFSVIFNIIFLILYLKERKK